MKIAVLCNSLMGLPAIQSLAGTGRLAGVAMPDIEHDATAAMRQFVPELRVPLTVFRRETFAEDCVAWLQSNGAGVVLVFTFPWLVREPLLSVPPAGFLNFHFGLLPQYRGADAIFWEIRNREPLGAVTVHRMEAGLDTGPIALQQMVPIRPGDTYGTHMAALSMAAMEVTGRLLPLLDSPGSIAWQPQDESLARVWPKPGQREVIIDWERMTAAEILALIRACNPWNKGAYTFLGGQPLRLTVALPAEEPSGGKPPGTLLSGAGGGLSVACRDEQSIIMEAVLLESGFFSSKELAALGIVPGMRFDTPRL
jgi:methionyl-tRNA formyltransferase